VGGTSAAAPQWPALIAEVNQGRALVGLRPLDGASQTLPGIYAFSSALHDVTGGSNGYLATPGYNLVTGLGSPIAYVLAGDLAFHITSNYGLLASNALVATPSLPTGSQSCVTMMPMLSVSESPVPSLSGMDEAAHTDTTDSSIRGPLLIGLVPSDPAQSIDHEHDRLARALGSLIDEDLALLRF
jgi:hypothetical protein